VIGSGGSLGGAFFSNSFPASTTRVVITAIDPAESSVRVDAFERGSNDQSWTITAEAICATVN
jgi:hypothetical protein